MDPQRWREIRPLLDHALDLDAPARAAWLGEMARERPDDHAALLRLLERHDAAPRELERGAAALAADALAPGADADWDRAQVGRRVGAFRLVAPLGAGGMGTVYRAERVDGRFEQTVAIKLLRSPHPGLRERFRHEQGILAGLNHPNIAQLIDGGETDDGLPYLAMEYVDGVPLTRHCRDARLPLAQRLRLAIAVCGALAHAHRNLVIHRDIKPSNILVARADGRPKLLDFGIAKLIGGEGRELTQQPIGPMTPTHAAPEQFRGAAVTVATDVYQCGVLLYQLISGRLPFESDSQDPVALARAVLEDEPITLARALVRGAEADAAVRPTELGRDLDAIVRCCLAKEPRERYGSMDALIADLEAFLGGRPVQARHGGRAYELARFVRRHRVAAGASCLAALTLVGVAAFATVQAKRARADAERLRVSLALMNSVFNAADPTSTQGGRRSLEDVLDAAAKDLGVHLDQHPELRGPTSLQIANAYAGMGLPARAGPLYRQAIADLRVERADDAQLAQALERGAFAALLNGDFERAKQWVDEALPLATGADDDSALVRDGLYHTRWTLLRSGGEAVACLTVAEESVRNAQAQSGPTRELLLQRALARRGTTATDLGRFADAERDLLRSVELATTLFGADHARTLKVRQTLGWHYTATGRPEAGLAVLEPVGAKIREVLGERSQEWAANLFDRGNAYAAIDGRWEEAVAAYRDAGAVYRVSSSSNASPVAWSLVNVAGLLAAHERCAEALPTFLEVQRIWEPILEPDAPVYATLYTSTAECALKVRDLAAAREQVAKAEAVFARGGRPAVDHAALFATSARLAAAEGDVPRAASLFDRAVAELGGDAEAATTGEAWRRERARLVHP